MHSGLALEYSHLEETTSTNDYLRNLTPSADITVVSTSFQTKGRGQMGNTWVSDRGKNALFSVLVRPKELKATDGFVLSQAMALAIKETLDEHIGEVCIKWPNDIYHEGRKICGTLIENTLMGKQVWHSVIGSGINVNQRTFPDGLAAPATSICLILDKELSPEALVHAITERFAKYYEEVQQGHYCRIRELYHDSLYLKGEWCRFQDDSGAFIGCISHVEPDGHIVIKDSESVCRRYAFKQVKLIHSTEQTTNT